jgi:Bax protein
MNILFKIALLIYVFIFNLNADTGLPKEYYKLSGVKAKAYFFDYFGKRINIENRKILQERDFITSLNRNKNLDISSPEYKRLKKIQEKYKVKKIYDYNRYFERVDIIPPSLAIAQAATESGWGKSRFFKKANNIFGHWTYNEKIGMLPLRRKPEKKHLIRIFPNLQSSIATYMRNLNRTSAYYQFRLKRKKMRDSNTLINGLTLSSTMDKYSGIGHEYLKILSSIIRKSNLVNLDKKFQNEIKKTNKITINTDNKEGK